MFTVFGSTNNPSLESLFRLPAGRGKFPANSFSDILSALSALPPVASVDVPAKPVQSWHQSLNLPQLSSSVPEINLETPLAGLLNAALAARGSALPLPSNSQKEIQPISQPPEPDGGKAAYPPAPRTTALGNFSETALPLFFIQTNTPLLLQHSLEPQGELAFFRVEEIILPERGIFVFQAHPLNVQLPGRASPPVFDISAESAKKSGQAAITDAPKDLPAYPHRVVSKTADSPLPAEIPDWGLIDVAIISGDKMEAIVRLLPLGNMNASGADRLPGFPEKRAAASLTNQSHLPMAEQALNSAPVKTTGTAETQSGVPPYSAKSTLSGDKVPAPHPFFKPTSARFSAPGEFPSASNLRQQKHRVSGIRFVGALTGSASVPTDTAVESPPALGRNLFTHSTETTGGRAGNDPAVPADIFAPRTPIIRTAFGQAQQPVAGLFFTPFDDNKNLLFSQHKSKAPVTPFLQLRTNPAGHLAAQDEATPPPFPQPKSALPEKGVQATNTAAAAGAVFSKPNGGVNSNVSSAAGLWSQASPSADVRNSGVGDFSEVTESGTPERQIPEKSAFPKSAPAKANRPSHPESRLTVQESAKLTTAPSPKTDPRPGAINDSNGLPHQVSAKAEATAKSAWPSPGIAAPEIVRLTQHTSAKELLSWLVSFLPPSQQRKTAGPKTHPVKQARNPAPRQKQTTLQSAFALQTGKSFGGNGEEASGKQFSMQFAETGSIPHAQVPDAAEGSLASGSPSTPLPSAISAVAGHFAGGFSTAATGLPGTLSSQFLGNTVLQMIQTVQLSFANKQQTMTLQLQPEHLGVLRIQIRMKDDRIEGRFEFSRPEALHLLQQQQPELVQRLQDMGLRIHQWEMAVNPELASGLASDHPAAKRHSGHNSRGYAPGLTEAEISEKENLANHPAKRWMGYNTIDILA